MKMCRLSACLFLAFVAFSCKKEDTDAISIEGKVRDAASGEPLSNVYLYVDGIKSPTGMGIITDGKRKNAGQAITDANGHYKTKLNVFNAAERLEIFINGGEPKEGYADAREEIDLSKISRDGTNKLDFVLHPTGLLKINFRNAAPVSDSDYFELGWSNGTLKGIVQKEICGTVSPAEDLTWTGKDVCGSFTVAIVAEEYAQVYWSVRKNGVMKFHSDSVFVKRSVANEFSLTY